MLLLAITMNWSLDKGLLAAVLIPISINAYSQSKEDVANSYVQKAVETRSILFRSDAYNKFLTEDFPEKSKLQYSFDTIRKSLLDDEISIELYMLIDKDGKVTYAAYTMRNNYKTPHVITLFDEEQLNNLMLNGDDVFINTMVLSMFLKPLQKELEGIRRIFFTPAGKLHQFAIEYGNAGDGQMLAEKYEFYRLTSSTVLTQRGNLRKPYTVYTIFGGIDFDKLPDFEEKYQGGATKCRYGYLQDSYEVAIDIHHYLTGKGLHGELYVNEMATETALKQLSGQNVQLFFIMTHGICKSCKENNAYPNTLLLAGASYALEGGIIPEGYEDGLLTTDEIAKLDLSHVDLAVISACKSSLGETDNKGVGGLMRAFKIAGAKSLVMTTDDVVDYVSGEVWKVFFRNLVDGKSKREALLDAVKHVRTIHDGFYRAPKFWTPFILIDGLD